MKVGYVLLGLILGSVITIAVINATPATKLNLPIIPTTTKTITKTTTESTTLTATVTETSTKTLPITKTRTKTLTTTKTETTTATKTTTETTTETRTTTKTVTTTTTVIKVESSFQYLTKPDKVINLVAHANKTVIAFITYPASALNFDRITPQATGQLLKALLNASKRGANVYVIVGYNSVCTIANVNKTLAEWFIQKINKLNQTLPPKHVIVMSDNTFANILFVADGSLFSVLIDGKYYAVTDPKPSAPVTRDYGITYLLYNPQIIGNLTHNVIKGYIDDEELYEVGFFWYWHACKESSSGT